VDKAKLIFFEGRFNVWLEINPGLHNDLVVFDDFTLIFPDENQRKWNQQKAEEEPEDSIARGICC